MKVSSGEYKLDSRLSITQKLNSKSIENLEDIDEKIKEDEGKIKSQLLEYVKKNPKNYKVLMFLSKQ